jgi:mRNA interferase RelE/StbE
LAWQIDYTDEARRTLKSLDSTVSARITKFMEGRVASLDDPTQIAERLKGQLSNYWRYRVGDYRIICEIRRQILTVVVIQVGHRREIYRG